MQCLHCLTVYGGLAYSPCLTTSDGFYHCISCTSVCLWYQPYFHQLCMHLAFLPILYLCRLRQSSAWLWPPINWSLVSLPIMPVIQLTPINWSFIVCLPVLVCKFQYIPGCWPCSQLAIISLPRLWAFSVSQLYPHGWYSFSWVRGWRIPAGVTTHKLCTSYLLDIR